MKPQSIMQLFAKSLLELSGWRLVGQAPDIARCLIIFAPHTSSWDFPLLLCVRFALGRRVSYLAKQSLFRFPLIGLLRWTGAIPVERAGNHELVSTLADAFRQRNELWLAMSPEGTRAKTDHWKSGFYHVAREAKVPLLLGFIDARKRECGVADLLELSGDMDRDMAQLRAFYSQKQGIVPERASDIRLRSPSEPD
jgi:1-acyl-sn-glycerol-3-phosphate acyltransferase